MQVILQGSLRHFPPAELLAFLCHPGRKGTLDLETAGRRTRILFENETILSAQSKTAGEGIDAALEILEWTEGTFTLLDAAVLPEGTTALGMTLADLHAEAKKRAEEKAAGFPDAARFHVVEDPALQQQVSLKAEEFKLLFRLAPGRSFGELLAEFPVPRKELAERLRYLQGLGLIASESESGAAGSQPAEALGTSTASAGGLRTHGSSEAAAQNMATVPENVPLPPEIAVPEADQTMMQLPPEAAPAPPPRRPTLVGSLTPDESPDNVFPLLDAECLIGRKVTKEVAFSVDDGSISSKHAKLTRTADGFLIEDLGSKNGTFVNGEKVTEKRLLADGDLIRLGKVIMTFNVARQAKAGEQTVPEIRVG
jgi:FHA domain-containing protein/uncharacterized protein DUF4388